MLTRSEVVIRTLDLEIFISENGDKKTVTEKASDYSHGTAVISTEAIYAILQIKAAYVYIQGPA